MTEQHAESYARLRDRVAGLVLQADPASLEESAPATPEWRVRDVLAHMVGVADDIVNDRRDGIASDTWTAAQVERRRTLSVSDLLADWDTWAPGFEQLLGLAPMEVAGQALFDAVTHEHDIRNALARPGARDSDAMNLAWEWLVAMRPLAGGPTMRFVTEQGAEISGTGEPVATVRAPRFEVIRATTGRRTEAEIEGYEWEPKAEAQMLLAAPIFTLRSESLAE